MNYSFVKETFKDKSFLKKLILLTLPLAGQNLFESITYTINGIMIGNLGDASLAGVGIASQLIFVLVVLLFGINSGASVFISQFHGIGDNKNIRRVNVLGFSAGILLTIIATVLFAIFPENIMSLFSKDNAVITIGADYLRLSAPGLIPIPIVFSIMFCFRGMGIVKAVSIIGIMNTLLSLGIGYCYIFGFGPIDPIGAKGAALGNSIARWIQIIPLIVLFLRKKQIIPLIEDIKSVDLGFIKSYFSISLPVILNEGMWVFGITAFTLVYGRLGTEISAASNIFLTIEKLGIVAFWGLSQTSAIMVGNALGAGKEREGFEISGRILIIGGITSVFVSLSLFVLMHPLVDLFHVSQIVRDYSFKVILLLLILMPIKAFNTVNLVGILRSGGDTKFVLILEMMGLWCVAVPACYIAAFIFKFDLGIVYLAASLEEIIKFILGFRRYLSRKWINNLTEKV